MHVHIEYVCMVKNVRKSIVPERCFGDQNDFLITFFTIHLMYIIIINIT